ncbi:hypothetical protein INR49_021677 [Caranx melampygus]|nr:hypothetical protein INR49_021677 [Caranx melampygus]
MSYPLVFLLCVGLLQQTTRAVIMDKLADSKICGDAECSHVLPWPQPWMTSLLLTADSSTSGRVRWCMCILNLYQRRAPESSGLEVYVYSDRYVDQMGIIGYFPATVLKETHKFTQDTVKIPTTSMDFYCD